MTRDQRKSTEVTEIDRSLVTLLKRLKATSDPAKIRQLSEQVERVVFHKQLKNT